MIDDPRFAVLQRELLSHAPAACETFYSRYFDGRGFFQRVERRGADDGPDDAIENCNNWPQLHALGGSVRVLTLYRQAWEGRLLQYTRAHTRRSADCPRRHVLPGVSRHERLAAHIGISVGTGWHGYKPGLHRSNGLEIWYLSMRE